VAGDGVTSIVSERIDVKGLNIHYFKCGKGDPLIIVHGGSDGARAWRRNIALLSRKYTVYVPDLPGFGLSESYPGDYYIPEMVEFLENFVSALDLKSFYLMGHSWGGGISAHYALRHPEKIRKLVLVSSICMGKEIAWWVRLFSAPWICRPAGKVLISTLNAVKWAAKFIGPWEIVQPFTRASLQVGSGIATLTQQTIVLLSQLNNIMIPTLVLWGAKDAIVPFAHAYAAAEMIPDCQVKVFENAGHSVYRENLREFSNVLAGFLG
jgi:pimeloyl-ACP methyl ester carboxylesterase